MYQLKIGTVPLPKLYICERNEVSKCRELGIPYLVRPRGWSDEKIIKAILWRTLIKKFPYIKWGEVLGFVPSGKEKINVPVDDWTPALGIVNEVSSNHRENPGVDTCGCSSVAMEVTEDGNYRSTGGGLDPEDTLDFNKPRFEKQTIDKYIGDLGWGVNIEELQQLRLLPVFLDDIANAIKTNLLNTMYMDGYNKKLECNVGSWRGSEQAPNLIILDVSGSIPSGIASTMISLIETLRSQANADLIITSGRSEYWAANTEMPNADKLSYLIGGCNECVQFYYILRNHVLGKHWGNVIIFGDDDSPLRLDIQRQVETGRTTNITLSELQSTRIDRIMAFHTCDNSKVPGYGLWATDACPKAEVIYNTEWVNCMRRY